MPLYFQEKDWLVHGIRLLEVDHVCSEWISLEISPLFLSGGLWLGATAEMFHFETHEQQWVRRYFLCFYFSILLIWYSAFWYSNIHFLSISFWKGRGKKHTPENDDDCKGMCTFSIVIVILLPDFHLVTWVTDSRPISWSHTCQRIREMALFFKIPFSDNTCTWWAAQQITLSLFFILPVLSHCAVFWDVIQAAADERLLWFSDLACSRKGEQQMKNSLLPSLLSYFTFFLRTLVRQRISRLCLL